MSSKVHFPMRIAFHGGSALFAAILTAAYLGSINEWWAALAPLMLIEFGPALSWNSSTGWSWSWGARHEQ